MPNAIFESRKMNAQEYENYVAELVSQLDVFSAAKIYRNKQFEGIRQPGQYEIDIGVEFFLGSSLRFLLIIECKNWGRPIDRPVVQKLIQTRDAISAHKAALVSPVGFTKEAIEVAQSHGVALWTIAEKSWDTNLYSLSSGFTLYQLGENSSVVIPDTFYDDLRSSFLRAFLKFMGYIDQTTRACSLIEYCRAHPKFYVSSDGIRIKSHFGLLGFKQYESYLNDDLSFDIPYYTIGHRAKLSALDSRTALSEMCDLLIKHLNEKAHGDSESDMITEWKKEQRIDLQKYPFSDQVVEKLLSLVITNSSSEFNNTLHEILDSMKGKS